MSSENGLHGTGIVLCELLAELNGDCLWWEITDLLLIPADTRRGKSPIREACIITACNLCAQQHNVSFNSNYEVHFTLALLGVSLVWHHKVTGSITGIVENTFTVFQHCCLKKRRVESQKRNGKCCFRVRPKQCSLSLPAGQHDSYWWFPGACFRKMKNSLSTWAGTQSVPLLSDARSLCGHFANICSYLCGRSLTQPALWYPASISNLICCLTTRCKLLFSPEAP